MLVIQFKTIGAYPFFKFPIQNLNDKVINAEDIFGNDILELRHQILKRNKVSEKFKLTREWLIKNYDPKKIPHTSIVHILNLLKTKSERENTSIIDAYSKSQKHLINQFKTYFGLTPKVFHRIFRFNDLLLQIHQKQNLDWSQIAYEFGYSDQSHFIKEFKAFSGFNPQEFIKSGFQNNEPNFFPLDKKG
nr:helix-turn-helix domain-containing protein [Psychroserpens sp. SPM9]